MAGPIYFDIASGKPLAETINGEGVRSSTVDLLWRYRFAWIIIDRWTDELAEVPPQNELEPSPLVSVEFSTDGRAYIPAKVVKAVVCSNKGSRGTHRSLQLMFGQEMRGRFIRITYAGSAWKYKVRASLQPAHAAPMEVTKSIEIMPLPNQHMMLDNPVRAAILGGSNSVMRYGWTKGLRSVGITITDNASLGSSSNAILGTRLPDIQGENIDVLLINSTINEYIPTRDNAYDLDLSRQFVRHIQAWCAQRGILPVFIIYPQHRVLDDIAAGRQYFDQEAYCIEQCEDLDIPYINAFELTRQLSRAWSRPMSSLYLDSAHLNHATAQVLGAAIAERVWRFHKLEAAKIEKKISQRNLTHDFKVLNMDDAGIRVERNGIPLEPVTRRLTTAIVDQTMITISGGEKLLVPVPAGWEVVAYTMNARRCNTSIRIAGENTVERRGDFAAYRGEEGFPFVCARSLISAVRPVDGWVSFECVQPAEDQERDEIANGTLPAEPVIDPEFELSQIVIREKVRRNPYLRVGGIELDLTESSSIDFATMN